MNALKNKSNKKQPKKVVLPEKQVPNFDGIEITIRDCCSLLQVASKILTRDIDDEYGDGTVVLDYGVKLLKLAAEQFDGANFRLREFCRENNLTQVGAP